MQSRKKRQSPYHIGDEVWLFDPTTPKQRSKKLIKRWRGPYVILRIKNGGMNVTLMKNDTETTVNVDRIRPYEHGVQSIEEQHARDIELAADELTAINDTLRDLSLRKTTVDDGTANISCWSQILNAKAMGNSFDPDKHDELYDFDDDDDRHDRSRLSMTTTQHVARGNQPYQHGLCHAMVSGHSELKSMCGLSGHHRDPAADLESCQQSATE